MTRNPEMAFEVSWEVCNKVGGIHTVIASKAPEILKTLGENYIVIGPDIWREERTNPEFSEDNNLFRGWKEQANSIGLHFRTGRWNIEGNPIAIIVDFTSLFPKKNEILSKAWERWKLDSLSGQWEYVEAALFGYAAGQVIQSFVNYYRHKNVVAHFHEWMTGMGVLYLGENAPHIATAFTTHATVLGRSVAGNGMPLYEMLDKINGDEMAAQIGVRAKHSLEKTAANNADCFSTVSDITAKECTQFLSRTPDVVTPNGFEPLLVPGHEEMQVKHLSAREKLLKLSEAISGVKADPSSMLIGTSGRYEFRNKGLDLYVQSLGALNKLPKIGKSVIAFVLVPANHYGPRTSVVNRLNGVNDEVKGSPYLSHNLHDQNEDLVIKAFQANSLFNREEDHVRVFFIPSYLNGDDGVLNISYYDLLMGLDLTIFPSYYEPWGYTPLESLAFGVPTITSNLAGFGLWVRDHNPQFEKNGIIIIDRDHGDQNNAQNALTSSIEKFLLLSQNEHEMLRSNALKIAETVRWRDLISAYYKLFTIGFNKAGIHDQPEWETPANENETMSIIQNKTDEPKWKPVVVESILPEKLKVLNDIAKNLWWSWNYRAEKLFEAISKELWAECEQNPVKLLMQVPFDRFQELESDESFMNNYAEIVDQFHAYVNKEANSKWPTVAYFSMEYGFHASLKIYSGGLGILAGDYLKEASDRNYPLVAIGLLYRHGYFKQVLTMNGEQLSENIREEFAELPIVPVYAEDGQLLKIQLAFPGRILHARVWQVRVGRINLYLLDSDVEENQQADRELTSNLYGGDEEVRLKQEMLLGVGGIRTIAALGLSPNVFHCNEGHAAFISFERIRHLMENKNFTFNESVEVVRSSTLFTTHTPVPAGHDAFHEDLLRTYMGHYPGRFNISWQELVALGRMNPGDPHEKFSMSYLAAKLSQEINAVSNLHGEVTRDMFAPLWKGFFPDELHIGYVTNGVHYQTWTAEAWQKLHHKTFGPEFLDNQSNPQIWSAINNVKDEVVWKMRNDQRIKLIAFLKDRLRATSISRHDSPKQVLEVINTINPKALTIGFARRFATYKRAHLLFKDLARLAEIVNNPDKPVQFLFAGKAHPRDKAGQDLIKFIVDISRKPEFTGKIIFLENYDMTLARHLVQGVDIWLNTPTRPLEASGTSGMKAAMNGAMNFSVLDGWWCEGYRQGAGWALPEERVYADQEFQDELDATTIYNMLEDEIVPLYYKRNEENIPVEWTRHIKNTIAQVAPLFTTKRMIDDYIDRFYSILGSRASDMKAGNYHLARELTRWKKKVANLWDQVKLVSLDYPEDMDSIQLGSKYRATIVIDTGELSPENIGVELVVVADNRGDRVEFVYSKEFKRTEIEGSLVTYKMNTIPTQPGAFKFGIRVYPKHEKLPNRQDFNFVKWL